MANILDILTRAQALRQETALNSITPDRAGGIMYDTLILINQMQLEGGSLLISKVYSSVAAMEADTTPTSDLTGRALRPGQLAVIVPSSSTSSDMGSVYRYNEPGSWTLCGKIGGLPLDTAPIQGSSNGITSGAVYTALSALRNEGYKYMGIATPGSGGTAPGTPNQPVFYVAAAGSYPNFGNLTVASGHLGFLKYSNGSWTVESIEVGKDYDDEISQLQQEIDGLVVEHFTRGGSINSGGTVTANDTYCYSDWIPVTGGLSYTVDYGTPADTQNEVFYNSEKSKLDYWPLYPSYGPLKTVTAPASSAYLRFSFLPSYNAKVYQGETLIWQAQDITLGLEDRVEALENEVPGINADVQTLSGKIDSVKDDVSKIAVDKNTIDYGIKAEYEFTRISGTPRENITVSETETGINIAKTGGTNLAFKIILPKISTAGTYHIVFSSNKEMTSANIYKDGTLDSSVQATDNVCEFDYVYDGTYVLAIGTSMFYDQSSQDYSLVATVPNATGMSVLADNISERVQELEDTAQTPIPASVEGTNTFIGDGAGQNNTPIEGSDNGKYNTAVGKNAMRYNTLGDHNTALGFCSMNKNQDGRNNTALGEDALYENLHGGQNVAIGQHSGQDSQGGYNVFIGSNVARRMASGDLNVIIGAEAYNDYGQLGGSNMVLIGAYVRNSGNYDGVISIKGEEPTAAKQIRIGKADFSAFIIGNKKLNFNQDGTVTWEDVTPTP